MTSAVIAYHETVDGMRRGDARAHQIGCLTDAPRMSTIILYPVELSVWGEGGRVSDVDVEDKTVQDSFNLGLKIDRYLQSHLLFYDLIFGVSLAVYKTTHQLQR